MKKEAKRLIRRTNMMEVMYVAILVFLVLNTISFYILDYVTERLNAEKTNEMTENELFVYSVVRQLTKLTGFFVCATIVFNLIHNVFLMINNL